MQPGPWHNDQPNAAQQLLKCMEKNPEITIPVKPLHPTISMHVLHTALYAFTKVLTRRICLTIKSSFSW